MKTWAEAAILAATMMAGVPAQAHHSFAMFDRSKEVQITGTVQSFEWGNPHVWLNLVVAENGKQTVYGLEGSGINGLHRRGWTRDFIKPGDKATVIMNPLKNGTPGGAIVRVTGPNGTASDHDDATSTGA